MFALSNEQRKCFGLAPLKNHWDCIEARPSPHEQIKTYLYLDGNIITKCIVLGEAQYCEFELFEAVSSDRKYLLPKTEKGKPVLLSSSSIQKRPGVGMRLHYYNHSIDLYNDNTRCSYYCNAYSSNGINNLTDFSRWVANWCEETTDEDKNDIFRFSKNQRKHIQYQEGDIFRFKIDRRLYGYGRILLNYDLMRKKKIPFWDILMSKPVVCSVYHIMTENGHISPEELKHLSSLPSTIITDFPLHYGEYCIIGNLPVMQNEDYPIMYGSSISILENTVCYQCGKIFKKIENGSVLYNGFRNNGVSFHLNCSYDILKQCIEENSNAPYWSQDHLSYVNRDLRNPKFADELLQIKKQFDII